MHDGGTADGIDITGTADDTIIQNCRVDCNTGASGLQHGVQSLGDRVIVRLVKQDDCDAVGIQLDGNDNLAEGCYSVDSTIRGISASQPRCRIIGCHVAASDGIGMGPDPLGDNSVFIGNIIEACTGDEFDLDAAAENCVVVGNHGS